MGQLHGDDFVGLFDLDAFFHHIVVDHPHPTAPGYSKAQLVQPPVNLVGFAGPARRQFLASFLDQIGVHIIKVPHHQAVIQKAVAVIEHQRQVAAVGQQRLQTGQQPGLFLHPFQHRMAQNQIELAQILNS